MPPMLGVLPALTLGLAPWVNGVLGVLFVIVCLMLILTVLIQRPQGGGLAGAFGSGAGSGQTAFGTKTGDALTIFTIVVFVLFVGMSIGLNFALRPNRAPEAETASKTPGSPDPASETPQAPATGGVMPTPASDTPAADTPKPAEGAKPDAPAGTAPATTAPTTPPATTPPASDKPAGEKPADPAPKP